MNRTIRVILEDRGFVLVALLISGRVALRNF